MTLQRADWKDISQAVRDLVQAHTGPVLAARTVSAGLNSHLAVVLDTVGGPLFIKGVRTDHPGVVRQRREAMINPHVLPLAPQLRWQVEGVGSAMPLLGTDTAQGDQRLRYHVRAPIR